MKMGIYKKLYLTLLVLAAILLSVGSTFAQETVYKNWPNKNKVLATIAAGINSDNLGIQKSSISLAGKHQITDLVPELIKQFQENENSEVRYLAAMVLYKIGDNKGLDAIKAAITNEENELIKNFCAAVMLAENEEELFAQK